MTYKIKFEGRHLISLLLGLAIIVVAFVTMNGNFMQISFIFFGFIIMTLQFFVDYFIEVQRQKDIESRFPDYVRNMVGAVKSGMPISKAIIYISKTDYGALSYYAKKMSHQIEWNIPVRKVLTNFSSEINNAVIKRAISTVLEAEKSGGNIEDVLSSITDSLLTIKRLKQERKSSIQGQITQSYVIFFIFIIVLIVIQNVLIPYMSNMDTSQTGLGGNGDGGQSLAQLRMKAEWDFSSPKALIGSFGTWFGSIPGIFMMLAIFQSFFAGIVLGKMSEGDYRSGLRHSLIMMSASIFVLAAANSFLNILMQAKMATG